MSIVTDVPARLEHVRPERTRASNIVIALVRVAFSLLWLQNVTWKVPPDFGANQQKGLWEWAHQAVVHPVLPPYSWLVEHVILPGLPVFGWGVLLIEGGLGIFLLLGLATRGWAIIGILQTTVIILSVLNVPGEWPWTYYLMIMTSAMLWATAAGRSYGLDALLRARTVDSTSRIIRLYRWVS